MQKKKTNIRDYNYYYTYKYISLKLCNAIFKIIYIKYSFINYFNNLSYKLI